MQDFLSRISHFSPKRLALLADELQRRVQTLEQDARAPIAIVGIGCRFPGGVSTPEQYWDLLCRGVDAITEVPASRWDIDAFYDANPDTPGTMSTRFGGFLTDVDQFDPYFFGISPREAQRMDPQQRLLLEVTWEALEHAGVSADSIAGTRASVFVGLSASDYFQVMHDGGLGSFDAYTASGTAHSIASGRLSYVLGAHGPSVSIDTACSSSLVAIHQAIQSLRRGESPLAIAGGVNLILRPEITVALTKSHMLAPDGRCKAFDARADGFVRGEGCGMLVLKRLADAEAAGDRIIAVIRGSAVNQDGRSNGLTAPNGPAQEAVLREALADAQLDGRQVHVVEAHGTGTSLGDPIEVGALAKVFGAQRDASQSLLVASVKANIGHLEAAAGVAGVIKMALSLQHGAVPAQQHFTQPNPFIPWDEFPVRIPTALEPWPSHADAPRIGGVSSFGFSGTNVHMLLESAPLTVPVPATVERPRHVIVVSARTDAACRELAASYRARLAEGGLSLADFAHSTTVGRATMPHRIAVNASSVSDAIAKLDAVAAGRTSASALRGIASVREPKVALLFTGQGAQYVGMARSLYDTQPAFRAALDACAELLQPYLTHSLQALLFAASDDPSLLDDTANTQPALFAVEYALATMWLSWGVTPTAMLGHSIGEYVAACVAGVMPLGDALRLVAARGRLMAALPRDGAMAAVMADVSVVRSLIAPFAADVSIAAINGQQNVVVSGRAASIDAILASAALANVGTSRLRVSHAFHSSLVEPMIASFRAVAESITYAAPMIDIISNVTGERIEGASIDADYWCRHIRATVQFDRGVQALDALGCNAFIEAGPHPTLLSLAQQILPDGDRRWLPSVRRSSDDWTQVLDSLAALYVFGATIDWSGVDRGYAHTRQVLPRYPFQRDRFWVDVPEASAVMPSVAARPSVERERTSTTIPDRVQQMLYELRWVETSAVAPALPAPATVRAAVDSRIHEIARDNDLAGYAAFSAALDRLCASYILAAFTRLGAGWQVGSRFDAASLQVRLGVTARHDRLFVRLLEILAEDGRLRRDGGQWQVLSLPAFDDPELESIAVRERFPEGDAALTITHRCGMELAGVLRGETDPIPLLFPGGSLSEMERLYQTSPPARAYNQLLADAVQRIRAVELGRPLRILEVGAGTGSTTAYVLPMLAGRPIEYTFTDVSPLFLNRAREKFRAVAGMQYAILDISRDPVAQGFARGHYDVIIGANVMHATPDLWATMSTVRSLLVPGGVTVLLEGTAPQRFGDLTVGLLDGWWAFTDTARRQYALMSRPQWTALLQESGFASSAIIVDAEAGPVLEDQAIFVAQAPMTVSAPRAARHWAIIPDAQGIAIGVAAALERDGDGVSMVAGSDVAALTIALSAARGRGAPVTDVVHLCSIDTHLTDTTTTDALWHGQERLLTDALQIVQMLGAMVAAPALSIVTRGAQSAEARESANPAQATVWGFSHVVAIEHPELRCRRIDLDPSADDTACLDALHRELRAADASDDQVALRDSRRLVRRLVHYSPQAAATVTIGADRSYLITGGLRGLGLRTAEWLVERGARALVLMGRQAPDEAARAVIARLEARGAHVLAVQGDVSAEADVRRVLETITASMSPLAGIVHAAGALDDGVIAAQNWSRFSHVMAAKLRGTWHLHRLTSELDFFVLFSSGASVAGSAGQVNHAAANAFEDAFAWYRQALGQPTVSINWGPWADIGAAADRQVTGGAFLRPIPPDDGLRALEVALRVEPEGTSFVRAQVVVLAADWSQITTSASPLLQSPLFRRLAPAGVTARESHAALTAPALSLRERLQSTAANRRRAALIDEVRQLTVRVLGIHQSDALDINEPLRQLGLDSLMAVELRNLLGTVVERTLPATITFDHPTVHALVEFLAAEVFAAELSAPGSAEGTAAPATPFAAGSAQDLDDMSNDELALRLAQRLDALGSEDLS